LQRNGLVAYYHLSKNIVNDYFLDPIKTCYIQCEVVNHAVSSKRPSSLHGKNAWVVLVVRLGEIGPPLFRNGFLP